MTFINLTPHAIVACGLTIAPSGNIARVATRNETVGDADGVPLTRQVIGAVEGLPEPTDTILIVSAMVRCAVPHRTDVASPGDLVRDAAGNVVGCRNLIIN